MSLLDEFMVPGQPVVTPVSGPAPTLVELLGSTSRNTDDQAFIRSSCSGAVENSRDLARVLELPRRSRPGPEQIEQFRSRFKHLHKANPNCVCRSKFKRRCADSLLTLQAWGLAEIADHRGLLGAIPVGEGKTLLDLLGAMVLPECHVAVLLIPPNLREQLLNEDWEFYSQHWVLPNLANGTTFIPGRPYLHVKGYSELSSAKNTNMLELIKPDLVIADEAQNLRNSNAARTKRFRRYFSAHPETRFCAWSGTLTTRSLKDFAHLSNLALKNGSPTPLDWSTIEEWAGALDPSDWPTGIGALAKFCRAGEHVRDGYRRRFEETAGVISAPAAMNCGASLEIISRSVSTPSVIHDKLQALYNTWERPDGELLVSALDVHRCAKEISAGFYYHWIWPRNEPKPVQDQWKKVRKEWHAEMREKLKHSREFMDSPLLLTKAALRWHEGYTHVDHETSQRQVIPPHSRSGPLPVWDAETWPEWKVTRNTADPETEGVWIDEFLARDAAEFCRESPGIVWTEHDFFGRRVSALAAAPYYGPGVAASEDLIRERGERGIVSSIRAHGTGKNLQSFSRNLLANVPSDAATWEQVMGRSHRQGQIADTVEVHVYQHTPPVCEALVKAKQYAEYIEETLGGRQKLLAATYRGF